MSPTSSSRLLAGRNARSATLRTKLSPHSRAAPMAPAGSAGDEPYATAITGTKREPSTGAPECGSGAAAGPRPAPARPPRWYVRARRDGPPVHPARRRRAAGARRLRRRAPGRRRALRLVPRRGRRRLVPGHAVDRRANRPCASACATPTTARMPNVAVTVETKGTSAGAGLTSFGQSCGRLPARRPQPPGLDPRPRARWAATRRYSNTWSLGRLRGRRGQDVRVEGHRRRRRASYTLAYRVGAGAATARRGWPRARRRAAPSRSRSPTSPCPRASTTTATSSAARRPGRGTRRHGSLAHAVAHPGARSRSAPARACAAVADADVDDVEPGSKS